MLRRSFLGSVIGMFTATKLPYVAKLPSVPLQQIIVKPLVKGRFRTYLYVNGVCVEGPRILSYDVESEKRGITAHLKLEEIKMTTHAHVGPLVIADVDGTQIMRYEEINFDVIPGDTLIASLDMSCRAENAATKNMASIFMHHVISMLDLSDEGSLGEN